VQARVLVRVLVQELPQVRQAVQGEQSALV
jgi:hypothetical protein